MCTSYKVPAPSGHLSLNRDVRRNTLDKCYNATSSCDVPYTGILEREVLNDAQERELFSMLRKKENFLLFVAQEREYFSLCCARKRIFFSMLRKKENSPQYSKGDSRNISRVLSRQF